MREFAARVAVVIEASGRVLWRREWQGTSEHKSMRSMQRVALAGLISINPHYERDANVDALVEQGFLHPDTARIFRVGGVPITLYRHQAQAVAKASHGNSFVVTGCKLPRDG